MVRIDQESKPFAIAFVFHMILIAGVLILAGCEDIAQTPSPPYRYIDVHIGVGSVEGCHESIGIYYEIQNVSDETIETMKLSFYLYNSDGTHAPTTGRNYFKVSYDSALAPGERRDICTSLDEEFFYEPATPPTVDRFHIYEVDLSDGSQWRDPYAVYVWPGKGDE